jgi:hypothetical protein
MGTTVVFILCFVCPNPVLMFFVAVRVLCSKSNQLKQTRDSILGNALALIERRSSLTPRRQSVRKPSGVELRRGSATAIAATALAERLENMPKSDALAKKSHQKRKSFLNRFSCRCLFVFDVVDGF